MSGETVTGQVAGSEDGRARMTAGRAGGLLAIGGTPVVRLAHLADDRCAEVWVKMDLWTEFIKQRSKNAPRKEASALVTKI